MKSARLVMAFVDRLAQGGARLEQFYARPTRPLIYSALASRLSRSARTAALSPSGGEGTEMATSSRIRHAR